jgi:hypothetical protein
MWSPSQKRWRRARYRVFAQHRAGRSLEQEIRQRPAWPGPVLELVRAADDALLKCAPYMGNSTRPSHSDSRSPIRGRRRSRRKRLSTARPSLRKHKQGRYRRWRGWRGQRGRKDRPDCQDNLWHGSAPGRRRQSGSWTGCLVTTHTFQVRRVLDMKKPPEGGLWRLDTVLVGWLQRI